MPDIIDLLYGRDSYYEEMQRINRILEKEINDLNQKIQNSNESIEEIESIIRSDSGFSIVEDPRFFFVEFWIYSKLAPELDCNVILVLNNHRFEIYEEEEIKEEINVDWEKEGF